MKIPAGYELYTGPRSWKLINGAKFWNRVTQKWQQIDNGAYATGDGPIIVRKKKSITAYCATQFGQPTFSCIGHRKKDTLAKVCKTFGPNWRKTHPRLKIMKVIITEA